MLIVSGGKCSNSYPLRTEQPDSHNETFSIFDLWLGRLHLPSIGHKFGRSAYLPGNYTNMTLPFCIGTQLSFGDVKKNDVNAEYIQAIIP